MTICIAAISKYKPDSEEEAIIFCTDHMLTISSGEDELGGFEQSIEKFKILGDDKACMLSGNPLLADRIYDNPNRYTKIGDLAKQIYTNMVALRREAVERRFSLLGLNLSDAKRMLAEEIKNQHCGELMELYNKYSIETGVLLLGFDDENEGRIYSISELGFDDHRDVNFSAIGSGAIQALNSLLFQRHSKKDSLAKTIYAVYKAKRNSEVSRGVGRETDLMVLVNSGEKKVFMVGDEKLKILEKIFEEEVNLGKQHSKLIEIIGGDENEPKI